MHGSSHVGQLETAILPKAWHGQPAAGSWELGSGKVVVVDMLVRGSGHTWGFTVTLCPLGAGRLGPGLTGVSACSALSEIC